jgi:probable rRNA maturation factor
MKVYIKNQQKDLLLSPASVRKLVREVIALEDRYYDEVNIHFVKTPRMCAIHEEFFDDASPTDCMSFPLDEELMGDVFICPETAIQYAKKHQVDPYEETSLYVIHGLLHLMGYDDLNPKAKRKMRAAEKRHLNHLKSLSLLLHP